MPRLNIGRLLAIALATGCGDAAVTRDMTLDLATADFAAAADFNVGRCYVSPSLVGAPCSWCPSSDPDFFKFAMEACTPGNTCSSQGEGWVCVCLAAGAWSCCYVGLQQCDCTSSGCITDCSYLVAGERCNPMLPCLYSDGCSCVGNTVQCGSDLGVGD